MKLRALFLVAATSLFCLTNVDAAEIRCVSVWEISAPPSAGPDLERARLAALFSSGRRPTATTCKEALIKGVIEHGDRAKFAAFLRANHPFLSRMYLWSSGGFAEEAMEIGRLVRKGMLATQAPDEFSFQTSPVRPTGSGVLPDGRGQGGIICQGDDCHCASACFLIWAAGVERIGNALGLHRPSTRSTRFADLPPEQASASYQVVLADIERYLAEMEVPRRYIELMTDTSSNDVRWLDFEEAGPLNEVPSITEWAAASCGAISKSNQHSILVTQFLEAIGQKTLSREDKALLEKQIARKREIDVCTGNKIVSARDAISEITEPTNVARQAAPRAKTQAPQPPHVTPRPSIPSTPPVTTQATMPSCWDVAGITRQIMQANPGVAPGVLARAVEMYQISMGCRPAPQVTQCSWVGNVWTCRTQ